MIKENLEQEKFNKKLEEKLKVNYPEFKNKCDEVYRRCEENSNNKIIIIQPKFYICIFTMAAIIVIASLCFMNNKNNKTISEINDSINNLSEIEDIELKLIEIMKIDNQIEQIPVTKRFRIKMNHLEKEIIESTTILKNDVEWGKNANTENNYLDLDSICDFNIANVLKVIGYDQNTKKDYIERIRDDVFKRNYYSLTSLPYIDLLNISENELKMMLQEYSKDEPYQQPYYIEIVLNDNLVYTFTIHQSGYILVSEKNITSDSTRTYISLVKSKFDDFSSLLSLESLENYNKEINVQKYNVITEEYLDEYGVIQLSTLEFSASSIALIIKDEEEIASIMSILDLKSKSFNKEIYYRSNYDWNSISIGIRFKSKNGTEDLWTCLISEEGIISIHNHNDAYIYYSNKNEVNHIELLYAIRKNIG